MDLNECFRRFMTKLDPINPLQHGPQGQWYYDQMVARLDTTLTYARMHRRCRNDPRFKQFEKSRIALRCGSMRCWIRDISTRRKYNLWTILKDASPTEQEYAVLPDLLEGRDLWIELEFPFVADQSTYVYAGWITCDNGRIQVMPISDKSITTDADVLGQLFVAMAADLLIPRIRVRENPDSTAPQSKSRKRRSQKKAKEVTTLPNGRHIIAVSLIKWIRSRHGTRRRHPVTRGSDIASTFRRHFYCPTCGRRIYHEDLLLPCTHCGTTSTSIDEYRLVLKPVRGHHRGPKTHDDPPDTRYVA